MQVDQICTASVCTIMQQHQQEDNWFKKIFHHSQLGPIKKKKNPGLWARAQCARWL